MTERPILFSGPMVRAILEGRKTQTRRVVKPDWWRCLDPECEADRQQALKQCPYGQPGDRLWVRETFASQSKYIVAYKAGGECGAWMGNGGGGRIWNHHGYILEAPGYPWGIERLTTRGIKGYGGRWRPSIHMPRWASRITLEVTGVRIERLQEISTHDAMAEGIDSDGGDDEHRNRSTIENFHLLWDSINAKRGFSWDANPWVWVVEFKRI